MKELLPGGRDIRKPGSVLDGWLKDQGKPYRNEIAEVVCTCGCITGFNLNFDMPLLPQECEHPTASVRAKADFERHKREDKQAKHKKNDWLDAL